MKITIDESNVIPALSIVGVLSIPNQCCVLENVLITKTRGKEIYSCQCSCGGWCTSGHSSIEGAIAEWERMCRDSVLNR